MKNALFSLLFAAFVIVLAGCGEDTPILQGPKLGAPDNTGIVQPTGSNNDEDVVFDPSVEPPIVEDPPAPVVEEPEDDGDDAVAPPSGSIIVCGISMANCKIDHPKIPALNISDYVFKPLEGVTPAGPYDEGYLSDEPVQIDPAVIVPVGSGYNEILYYDKKSKRP